MPEPVDAETITAQIREAAYAAWQLARGDWQDRSRSFFERAYLGHFVSRRPLRRDPGRRLRTGRQAGRGGGRAVPAVRGY